LSVGKRKSATTCLRRYTPSCPCTTLKSTLLSYCSSRHSSCPTTGKCFNWLKHSWSQLHLNWKWYTLACKRSSMNSSSTPGARCSLNSSQTFSLKWWIMNSDAKYSSVPFAILFLTIKNNKRSGRVRAILYAMPWISTIMLFYSRSKSINSINISNINSLINSNNLNNMS